MKEFGQYFQKADVEEEEFKYQVHTNLDLIVDWRKIINVKHMLNVTELLSVHSQDVAYYHYILKQEELWAKIKNKQETTI